MIKNIQLLRALAALSVIFFHLRYHQCIVGSFGVDIFFVISGYIMTHICLENPRDFLTRRLIRIVPIYWFFTILVSITLWLRPDLLHSTTLTLEYFIKSILFIPYAKDNGWLFPILGVGWTLNFEMMFYLLIAVYLHISCRLAPLFAGLTLIAFYIFAVSSGSKADLIQFYRNQMVLEFALGILSYWILQKPILDKLHSIVWALCVVVMIAGLVLIEYFALYTRFPLGRFVLMGGASFLLLIAAVKLEHKSKWIQREFLLSLGNASYVIYLVHLFVIHFFNRILIKKFNFFGTEDISLAVTILTIITISISIHKRIEMPVNNYLKQLVKRYRRGYGIIAK